MILTPGIYEIISKPWRKPIAREQPMPNDTKRIPLKPVIVTDPEGKEHLVYAATKQGAIAYMRDLRTPPAETWKAEYATPDALIAAGRANTRIHNDPNPPAQSGLDLPAAGGDGSERTATE